MLTEQDVRTVSEAVGIFNRAQDLQGAIDELLSSGFHRSELSLLASDPAMQETRVDRISPPPISNWVRARHVLSVEAVMDVGSYISGPGLAVFFVGTIYAFSKRREAAANPWELGATTLEWTLSSPPPFHQYERLPRIE